MPQHAELPLWSDKNDQQKLNVLRALVLDLYRYQLGPAMDAISSILDQHEPGDEKEKNDIAHIRQLMSENPNLLNMNCENGHFTGSGLVVDVKNKRFLLHFHKKLERWFQFGGHPDYETDLSDVAMRETSEETGLSDLFFVQVKNEAGQILPTDIDIHIIPERKNQPEHPHLDFRYVIGTNTPELLITESENESVNFKWFDFDKVEEAQALVDPALYRLILKAKSLLA